MAKINPEQLTKTFKPALKPVYIISGDEPLLVQEACDTLRAETRTQGFSERELHHTNVQFQWPQLLQSANSFSLFAEKKLIEIRMHTTKIGDAGSKILQEYCANPPEDTVLMLVSPKLDRSVQNGKWCKALDKIGVIVTVWPINEQHLPRWIEGRMRQANLNADSAAIEVLANKVEGNLLAAIQEIEKLKLLAPEGVIDATTMASAVLDSARFDVFGLMDKTLAGNTRAASTSLSGLKAEGTDAIVVLWAASRDIRMLLSLKQVQQRGQNIDSQARSHGVFPQRLPLVKRALARLSQPQLEALLIQCAHIDQTVKGMNRLQNPWDVLLNVILTLAGQPVATSKVPS